jgi:hypothetical protein
LITPDSVDAIPAAPHDTATSRVGPVSEVVQEKGIPKIPEIPMSIPGLNVDFKGAQNEEHLWQSGTYNRDWTYRLIGTHQNTKKPLLLVFTQLKFPFFCLFKTDHYNAMRTITQPVTSVFQVVSL